jgi:hypothetical protein
MGILKRCLPLSAATVPSAVSSNWSKYRALWNWKVHHGAHKRPRFDPLFKSHRHNPFPISHDVRSPFLSPSLLKTGKFGNRVLNNTSSKVAFWCVSSNVDSTLVFWCIGSNVDSKTVVWRIGSNINTKAIFLNQGTPRDRILLHNLQAVAG